MINDIKHNSQLGKWLMILTGVVLVAYPTTRFVVNEFRSLYLVLLFLLSLIACGASWSQCRTIALTRLEKLLLLSFFLMFVVTLLSFVLFGGDDEGKSRVGVYMGFALAIPVYFLFKLYRPPSRIVWGALVIACFVVAARALLEVNGSVAELTSKEYGLHRANGTMHPIRFGNLSLLMAFISLAGAFYIKDIKKWMRVVGGIAFACGMIASVLSMSRGGWVAVPVLLVIVLWPLFRKMTAKSKIISLVFILFVFMAVFNAPGLKVGERFEQAMSDIEQYQQYDNSDTSIGARFDMYETAFWMFTQKPLFGVGVGNYQEFSDNYFELNKERMSGMAADRDNPHNEILQHMATRGVIGLTVLFMVFIVGIVMFVSRVRHYDDKTLFYAVSGLLVLAAYMHFGMSIAIFKHRDFLLFFVIYVSLFAAGANKTDHMARS